MKKFYANLICMLIPHKKLRHFLRERLSADKNYISFFYKDWEFINLGDYVQTIAVRNAIQSFCPNVNFIPFERNNLIKYKGKKTKCVMQGFFPPIYGAIIPSKKIDPVFVGYHLGGDGDEMSFVYGDNLSNAEKIVSNNIKYFYNKTIGCRDHITADFFTKQGIDSYFSRCMTFTFPKRKNPPKESKIFFADIHSELLEHIPAELKKDAVFTKPKIPHNPNIHYDEYMQMAQAELDNYRDNAGLVITNRIHVVAPCLAMGIPVILYKRSDSDVRYQMFDGILPVYSMADFKNNNVDYSPPIINIERLKVLLLQNLALSCNQPKSDKLAKIRSDIAHYTVGDAEKQQVHNAPENIY